MTNPCPGYSITTPYGKEGSAWSCGMHDGADWAAPAGTDVVAAWGGTVVEAAYPTSFGSAFGRAVVIDHDHLPDGSPGYWGLYAHLSAETVSVGQRVEAGQKIGEVGTTGNSTGNHLHMGVYRQPSWESCGGVNPQPWVDAQAEVPPGPVYLSKLVYGQQDSDSVRRLQQALNAHPLSGGETLPVTGNYLAETDEEVRLCQAQHGYGADPAGASSVGPKQAEHLFAGTGCEIIDDRPDTEEPPVTQPPDQVLVVYEYSGKGSGTLPIGTSYTDIDVASWTPPGPGLLLAMLYTNLDHTLDDGVDSAGARVRVMRTRDGDPSGYEDIIAIRHLTQPGSRVDTHLWFERCDTQRLQWQMDRAPQFGRADLTDSRYAKWLWVDEVVLSTPLAVAAGAAPAGRAGDALGAGEVAALLPALLALVAAFLTDRPDPVGIGFRRELRRSQLRRSMVADRVL